MFAVSKEVDRKYGHFIGDRCPKCGYFILENDLGQRWCADFLYCYWEDGTERSKSMFAALRGHYVQFVEFMGVAEYYPEWFIEEVSDRVFADESRFCFWTSPPERLTDYHEKELIESWSIVVRKSNGEHHVMDYDTFFELYQTFKLDITTNSGIAAFKEDVIEYVECIGGLLIDNYPEWVYEYVTECFNNPKECESYLMVSGLLDVTPNTIVDESGHITIKERCVFLRNKLGELKIVPYDNFLKHYDPMLDSV